jgi:resuscitation-promoting factor RpfB
MAALTAALVVILGGGGYHEPQLPEPVAPALVERVAVKPVPFGIWDRIAQCESNQRWHINTGNGFYGGLQFEKRSWDWAVRVGGHDVPTWPHHATREQQIEVAETLQRIHPRGWGAWPACARSLGLW